MQAAIDEIGYRQNTVARALAAGRTQTIGLSISALTNPYFGSLVHSIEERVSAAGYVLVLGDSHDDGLMEARVVQSLLERRVDGLIVAPAVGAERSTIPQILESGTPLVVIDRNVDANCDQVTPENAGPAYDLTNHLIQLGHTRIAVVMGLEGLGSTSERLEGYARALADSGIEVNDRFVLRGSSRTDVAERAVRRSFLESDHPSAVVVMNNAMTIGTVRALKGLGLDIPKDVALVCYDDFEWADLFEPRLTAVAQNVGLMGERAVELLLARVSGTTDASRLIRIPTVFQHRNSCGCAD